MKREGYEKICAPVRGGEKRFVEHRERGEIGRIISCHADGFEIEVSGRREFWNKEACDEKKDVSVSVSA